MGWNKTANKKQREAKASLCFLFVLALGMTLYTSAFKFNLG